MKQMNRWIALPAVAAVALVPAAAGLGAGDAGALKISANLNTKQEIPKPNATAGRGVFTGTIRNGKLSWRVTFSKLTGPANAGGHIHLAPRGKANPKPAVVLCGPCRSGQRGTVSVSKVVERAIKRGGAYVNIHTAKNPGGEIRGQLRVVTN